MHTHGGYSWSTTTTGGGGCWVVQLYESFPLPFRLVKPSLQCWSVCISLICTPAAQEQGTERPFPAGWLRTALTETQPLPGQRLDRSLTRKSECSERFLTNSKADCSILDAALARFLIVFSGSLLHLALHPRETAGRFSQVAIHVVFIFVIFHFCNSKQHFAHSAAPVSYQC